MLTMFSDRSHTREHPDWLHEEQKLSKPATKARLGFKNQRISRLIFKMRAFQHFSWSLSYSGRQAVVQLLCMMPSHNRAFHRCCRLPAARQNVAGARRLYGLKAPGAQRMPKLRCFLGAFRAKTPIPLWMRETLSLTARRGATEPFFDIQGCPSRCQQGPVNPSGVFGKDYMGSSVKLAARISAGRHLIGWFWRVDQELD